MRIISRAQVRDLVDGCLRRMRGSFPRDVYGYTMGCRHVSHT